MTGCARALAVLAVATTGLAACGGGHPRAAASRHSVPRIGAYQSHRRAALYRISLPVSAQGPTTCTVYESNSGTQIVVDSKTLDVRTQCFLWAANQLGVGYLWGYERSATFPTGNRLCQLTDPDRKVTASVIETAALVTGAAAERAKAIEVCAGIRAAGWVRVASRHGVSRARQARS